MAKPRAINKMWRHLARQYGRQLVLARRRRVYRCINQYNRATVGGPLSLSSSGVFFATYRQWKIASGERTESIQQYTRGMGHEATRIFQVLPELRDQFQPESNVPPPERGCQTRMGWRTILFSSVPLFRKRYQIRPTLLLIANRKLHAFSIGTKIDDLGWPWTNINLNFRGISRDFAEGTNR